MGVLVGLGLTVLSVFKPRDPDSTELWGFGGVTLKARKAQGGDSRHKVWGFPVIGLIGLHVVAAVL